jgi:CRISPR-associated endonuclease/helicase Cas3
VVPTGLGKTSVIAVWLLARERNASLPRRLVYVVNRRTVVDQTTEEVQRYRQSPRYCDLAVSTLRGELADNRDWSRDPSQPAVICGTVDMIGSRLLFGGYGIGPRARPLHAGLLGHDVLLVHDEAHLEPAFQQLLEAIVTQQGRARSTPVAPRLRVLALTATPRSRSDQLGVSQADRSDPIARKRLAAPKAIETVEVRSEAEVSKEIVRRCRQFETSGRAILVFVRTIDLLQKVARELSKSPVALLTGTMRGYERDRLVRDDSVFRRFISSSDAEAAGGTVYLVCTSAGEVGVNLSADDLVCDLAPFDAMAQRFGRVNRFGLRTDSRVVVVHTPPSAKDRRAPLDEARARTLELLKRLTSVSPDALASLDPKECEAAFTPTPVIPAVSDILFDAWSLTSIRGSMPGRPVIEPFLHGISPEEPPQTRVAWREEVGRIKEDLLDAYPPQELLELFPLLPHELLRDQTARVLSELQTLQQRFGERPVWVLNELGDFDHATTLAQLVNDGPTALSGRTVLLPHDVGGLGLSGLLDGRVPAPPKEGERAEPIDNDVSARPQGQHGPLLRLRTDDPDDPRAAGMRGLITIRSPEVDDDDAAQSRPWYWFETRPLGESIRRASQPVTLDRHAADVEQQLAAMLERCPLDGALEQALRLAARWHDLGKRREAWQRGIGRPSSFADTWYAKSASGWRPRFERHYRHEFGSLLDVTSLPEFAALDEPDRDLVLHLVAAHHGQARPHFEPEHADDPAHPPKIAAAMAAETPRRFARLQRRFGHWGLAYLESILRAADWHASSQRALEEPGHV